MEIPTGELKNIVNEVNSFASHKVNSYLSGKSPEVRRYIKITAFNVDMMDPNMYDMLQYCRDAIQVPRKINDLSIC